MSRHIPLLCRDPFFRDLERDFWGDRPAGGSSRNSGPTPVWEGNVPTKLFDQSFGGGLFPEDTNAGTSSLYHRSRRGPVQKSGVSSINPTPEKFSVSIEVPQFTPDELKVRVSQEGQLLEVEGKHEERADEHGIISRHFIRKYRLPDDAMVELVTSSLSPDGVLTVETPRKPPEPPKPSEREVPILKTERKSGQ
ncbi:Alpha crystallin/Hsp20 domain [Trinorchestia longiramus]|nr:Alpha crystallin/Hsp20 domain [Trinorchestia longiramus]